MKREILILVLASGSILAQPSLLPPRVGLTRDASNSLRPVFGTAGNFILGAVERENVLSAACSGRAGMAKTDEEVLILNEEGRTVARLEVGGGPALFAFRVDGRPGLVYLQGAGELVRWEGGRLEPAAWDPVDADGEVVALAVNSDERFSAVVQREGGLWLLEMAASSGRVLSQMRLPGASLPLHLRQDGTQVFAEESGLVIRTRRGEQRWLALPAPAESLEEMGEGWLRVVTGAATRSFALRFRPDGEDLYQLPGAP